MLWKPNQLSQLKSYLQILTIYVFLGRPVDLSTSANKINAHFFTHTFLEKYKS